MSDQNASPTSAGTSADKGGGQALDLGRRFERRTLDSVLSIKVDTKSIKGMADNISRAGLMLYTDQPLRVSVQIDGIQGGKQIFGRLIRLQSLDDTTTGVAIEFDELIDFDQAG